MEAGATPGLTRLLRSAGLGEFPTDREPEQGHRHQKMDPEGTNLTLGLKGRGNHSDWMHFLSLTLAWAEKLAGRCQENMEPLHPAWASTISL